MRTVTLPIAITCCSLLLLAACVAEPDDLGSGTGEEEELSSATDELRLQRPTKTRPSKTTPDAGVVEAQPDAEPETRPEPPPAPDAAPEPEPEPEPEPAPDAGVAVEIPPDPPSPPEPDCLASSPWRSWRPRDGAAPRTLIGANVGVVGNKIIIQGGRSNTTTLNQVSGLTFMLPAPSCASPEPDLVRLTTTGTAPMVWGAATASAADRLWVIGGTASGSGACRRETRYFEMDGPTSGRWVTLTSLLPEGLCHAAAQVLRDAQGKQWIVVTGGSTRSVPNTSCGGGYQPAVARILVLDPAQENPAWVSLSGAPAWRFGSAIPAARGDAALAFGGSGSITLPGEAMDGGRELAMNGNDQPVSRDIGGLPEARVFAAAATLVGLDGVARDYVLGGASALGPVPCSSSTAGTLWGSDDFWLRAPATGEFVALEQAPRPRAAHAMISLWVEGRERLYVIGGIDGTAPVWEVDEFTP